MTAAILAERRFTLAELHAIVRSAIKDRAYLATRLGPAVQEFLAWKRLSGRRERTLEQIEYDLARLALAVPDKALEDVETADLMLLLSLVPEASRRRFRSHWNGLFVWAQAFERRPDNPCARLPVPKQPTAQPYEVFTLGERQALLNGCAHSLIADIDYARVLTLIETGARKSEAMDVKIEHFDLRERAVLLHGKGGKDRWVAVRAELVNAIDRLLLEDAPALGRPLQEGDYLWFPWHVSKIWNGTLQATGLYPRRRWTHRGFHDWWVRRVADAGIRYRKPHMTRHTFGTDLYDAGAQLYDIKELMGHESTRTTEVYIHSSRTRLSHAIDKLSEYRNRVEN